jgi:hypothetical protein
MQQESLGAAPRERNVQEGTGGKARFSLVSSQPGCQGWVCGKQQPSTTQHNEGGQGRGDAVTGGDPEQRQQEHAATQQMQNT